MKIAYDSQVAAAARGEARMSSVALLTAGMAKQRSESHAGTACCGIIGKSETGLSAALKGPWNLVPAAGIELATP
ncbi:hypothetical protein ACPRNU_00955 [Chromobacterium vaccinii]|uniref:hypothetical protein n=1 Tax=Chromobacterium vaccinii TaxID=1108595 RepID=UPI003C717002